MKKVLILIHTRAEGPGTLVDFLEHVGASFQTVRLYEEDKLPAGAGGFDAVVTMGGPMSVNDEDLYPFIEEEKTFLRRAIDNNLPVLGICLGAQMIAKACGAVVKKSPEKEIGWKSVSKTDLGRRDILFQGLPRTMTVFQWHEESFEVPEGGSLLALSKECPNQAFRYRNAYGLQFHIEVTRDMLLDWMDPLPECNEIISVFEKIEKDFCSQARTIYTNFLWLTTIRESMNIKKK
jgi:GMP synthase (glutamine-hydrolysing)